MPTESQQSRTWSKNWADNWSMLLIPVGLVSSAIARQIRHRGDDEQPPCVFCGKTNCDESGECLAGINETQAKPHQS